MVGSFVATPGPGCCCILRGRRLIAFSAALPSRSPSRDFRLRRRCALGGDLRVARRDARRDVSVNFGFEISVGIFTDFDRPREFTGAGQPPPLLPRKSDALLSQVILADQFRGVAPN
jgi:hypothetical protein